MHHPISRHLSTLCRTLGYAAIVSWLGTGAAIAQTSEYAPCPAPEPGEYLLLTIANTEGDRDSAINFVNDLDNGLATQVCSYLDDTVVRIAGFEASSEASDLARSLTNDLGLSAFVTRLPEEEPVAIEPQFEPRPYGEALDLPDVQVVDARPAPGDEPATTPDEAGDTTTTETEDEDLPVFTPADMPPPQGDDQGEDTADDADAAPEETPADRNAVQAPPSANNADRVPAPMGVPIAETDTPSEFVNDGVITPPFNPQWLAEGYVVLVDYFNDPNLAAEVAAVTGQAVGLVSYGQRPFLMADFSKSETEANAVLTALNEAGLWPLLVDSRRAILLTPRVRLDR
ncbi:MAG: hypothetical protein EAZ61_13435 [Oscillatoriales cyanobacterium]|nr:MAG: hypothetical protein EAZ61_13435 [Oscillatoriales cyanobacterium]